MKSLWYRFINWLMKDTRSTSSVSEYSQKPNTPKEPPTLKGNSHRNDPMLNFIEQKKNRKPFYKDDNKKDWE